MRIKTTINLKQSIIYILPISSLLSIVINKKIQFLHKLRLNDSLLANNFIDVA
jgi:hypothetical protein